MLRTIFAIAVTGLIFAALPGSAQAAPVAPLPTGVMTDINIFSDVARRCWRDRWAECIAVAAGVTSGAASAAGDVVCLVSQR
ncbi:MAG TPA: hypothetical protein VI077_07550 [Pseudolabrys sp.]|jgi:hypothetical protein